MKLKNVDPTEFSEMYSNSFEPKQKVNKEAVQNIIGEFVYSGIFIMEVVLSEEDRPNSRAIITAMRDFISMNNLAVGLHERAGRIFLRNDAVPVLYDDRVSERDCKRIEEKPLENRKLLKGTRT